MLKSGNIGKLIKSDCFDSRGKKSFPEAGHLATMINLLSINCSPFAFSTAQRQSLFQSRNGFLVEKYAFLVTGHNFIKY